MYGGSGHVADRVDDVVHGGRAVGPEPDQTAPVEPPLQNLGAQAGRACRAERQLCSGLQLLPGMDERLPVLIVAAAQQQALHRSAARHPAAEQTRGKHARVVDDDEVARGEKVGQRREPAMCNGAGRAIQVKEPR